MSSAHASECVAACRSIFKCVAVFCSVTHTFCLNNMAMSSDRSHSMLQRDAVFFNVLQCVAARCIPFVWTA